MLIFVKLDRNNILQEHEKTFWTLVVIGGLIGMGKLLISDEPFTARLAVGRTILGAGVSLISGAMLLQMPTINPLALIGIASAFGILGSTFIEQYLKRLTKKWGG